MSRIVFAIMKMKIFIVLVIISAALACAQRRKADGPFLVKPYLQIGKNPTAQTLQLLWHTPDVDASWAVEYKSMQETAWRKADVPIGKRVAVGSVDPHRIYDVTLAGLEPGGTFVYRILHQKKVVFTADARALKGADQAYRFIAFGDCGAGTPEQRPLANLAFSSHPDLVVIPGDIVYEYGLLSEYYAKFWPIYNADKVDEEGAPLMRSVPFVASTGNHDSDMRDLDKYPDALAYYIVWNQPLNGPLFSEGSAAVPPLWASDANRKAFMDAAGDAYPRMTNFSFDYGNAHWLVIDSNLYIDWTDKTLTDWVAQDLASAKNATWRFVAFHYPGFNSSREHYEEQHMRLLSPVFEAGNVDVVFNGHVHNYQRSFPLTFTPDKTGTLLTGGKDGKTIHGRVVNGEWKLDKVFDGVKNTKPQGVIYIVTGAGGQELYNPEQTDDPDSWQKFTDKFISNTHSLTVADVEGTKLTLRQLRADGTELDKIIVTKDSIAAQASDENE